MALTELQQPGKNDFYANMRNRAATLYNTIQQAKGDVEFLERMDPDTLTNMGIPNVENLWIDLADYRTMLEELVNFVEGTANIQTVVPTTVLNKIRNF